MILKEGTLQIKGPVLTGFKDYWFILNSNGSLKYFKVKPTTDDAPPKGQMILVLSDVFPKEDGVSFKIVSANNQMYRLRANNREEADKWLRKINKLRSDLLDKMFQGIYESENGSDVKDDADSSVAPDVASLFDDRERRPLVVAAIDFGTTYSGCAFLTKKNFESKAPEPETIHLDKTDKFSNKTPTVLLLKRDGTFHAFGAAAEKKYEKIAADGRADEYYYFERFKMLLYKEQELSTDTMIKEESGKTMKAIKVFAICINHIRNIVMKRLGEVFGGKLDEQEVHWVLTVPAIWSDKARQFMIAAAEKGGIQKKSLSLALEPEAAAMYCKSLETRQEGKRRLSSFAPSARFMVVDMGGGTIDITVSEVLHTEQLKEIYKATGGTWGGNYVNKQIVLTLKEAIGWETFKELRKKDLDKYMKLIRTIETEKRGLIHGEDEEIQLEVSERFVKNCKIVDKYQNDITTKKDKIFLSASLMQKIICSSIYKIIDHVDSVLAKDETWGVSTIFLVGGYASSETVKQMFSKKYERRLKVVCPLNSDMIVLKGAAIIGHMKEAIIGRVSKCHYGLALKSLEPRYQHLVAKDDERIFSPFIKKGQKIQIGEKFTVPQISVPAKSDRVDLGVYTTDDDEPRSIIDKEHFNRIGHITIKMPRLKNEMFLNLAISYDETEFKVEAKDSTTEKTFCGTFNFLEAKKEHQK